MLADVTQPAGLTTPESLTLRCVIPNTGNPIAFAEGSGEEGTLKLAFQGTGEDLQRLLALRGFELIVVLQEAL